jgi:glyoxylase-like metal-dependent hydrolase (beta-lactamase superfamily II)
VSISRRQFLATSSALLAAMPVRHLLAQQQAAATPPPDTAFQIIRGEVGYFTGRGGTIGWLSTPDALVVVDTQYADTAGLCLDGLPGRKGRTIDRVFNTHHHADHTGGNGVFRKVSTKIVAQTHVPELQRAAYATSKDAQVYADSTFDTTWSETVGKQRVTASFRGPGHTGGDSIVHFEHADIVHLAHLAARRSPDSTTISTRP